jgi:hypothetical protein
MVKRVVCIVKRVVCMVKRVVCMVKRVVRMVKSVVCMAKSVVCMLQIGHSDGLLEEQAIALPCLALLSYLDSGDSTLLQKADKFVPVCRVLSSRMPTFFIFKFPFLKNSITLF